MRILYTIIALFSLIAPHAQYGNEWIDYSQQYLKFPVTQTGIHKLEYNTINNALGSIGVPINSINSDNFKIFGREKEIAVQIVDGGDGTIDPGDYMLFYAQKNDGWNDSYVYDSVHFHPDEYYSLFNDTIRYYLTWGSGNGKRFTEESNVNFAAYSSQNYCWKTEIIKYKDEYNEGIRYEDLSSPQYSKGEGWMSAAFLKNTSITTNIPVNNVYTGVGAPDAKGMSISASASASSTTAPGLQNHALQLTFGSGNTVLMDTLFYDYSLIKHGYSISPVNLETPTTSFTHKSYNIGQVTDRQYVSSLRLDYPHTFDFEGSDYFDFLIPFNLTDPISRISITNFGGTIPVLYIINNDTSRIVPLVDNAGTWEALIPNHSTGEDAICLLVDSTNTIPVLDLSTIGNNGYFRDFTTLSPNQAFIIITHASLLSAAKEYAAYRSGFGGGHDTVVVDVEELYHQFGGGVYQHAGAIKKFCEMAINTWPSVPGHLFLLGKSVRGPDEYNSIGSRHSTISYQMNMVPSFGYPCSDNHFTVGLGTSPDVYVIPTGRYSSFTNTEALEYLNKVKEHETQQDPLSSYTISNKEWQKNILHFSGGASENEQNAFVSFLGQYETTIEDTLFGGDVTTFAKDPNSNVLDNGDFFAVQQKLLEGVSLITFLGHASAGTGFAQNIDVPDNWNNKDKYPLVIGLGCYTGDVHQPGSPSYAEEIVRPAEEGAIAFNSTVKLGYVNYLHNYAKVYYHKLGKELYGESIGICMKSTTDSLLQIMSPNVLFHSNVNGFSLQGDPALKLNYHEKPELVLSTTRVWTDPSTIDLAVDSFDLNIVITNIGAAFNDTFNLEIERHFPNGNDSLYNLPIPGVHFRDTVIYRLASNHSIGVGINNFTIKADLPFSAIEEHYDEINNNQITFSNFISSNELLPIWPYEYAIIPWDTITCKASTLNPFAPLTNYVFEIDTNDRFNSPFKKYQLIASEGGVVSAFPNKWISSSSGNIDPILFTDSTVYFWRCSPDSSVKSWQETSFQYIKDKWGWGQAHFHQFKNDNYTNISYNRPDRTFDFNASVATLTCDTYVNFTSGAEWTATNWSIPGVAGDYGGWLWPSIIVGVVDHCSLEGWCANDYCVGQFNGNPSTCPGVSDMGRSRCHGFFIWHMNNVTQLDSLASFLTNVVPDSNYIIAYTYIPDNYNSPMNLYDAWPPELFNAFQSLGATNMNPGQPDDGFIFFTKKGNNTSTIELHTADTISGGVSSPVQHLSFQTSIVGCHTTGTIKAETAGPANVWEALYWEQHPLEVATTDTTAILLYGIDINGTETLLIEAEMTNKDSILNLNNTIDATLYPFVRLEANTSDSLVQTPAQISRWQLLYQPVPECALNPKKGYYFSMIQDSIQEGDSIQLAIAIENVSAFDMDSLLVHYWLQDVSHNQHFVPYDRTDSLRSGDVLLDTVAFSTLGFPGLSSIWMAANPIVNGNLQDQPEQFYFNNIAQKTFNVVADEINPILDVTFDGIHILNGDIISPTPTISISLDDENEFILMDSDLDTSLFDLSLRLPETNSFIPLYFSNTNEDYRLLWEPAVDKKNKFKIEYLPTYVEDGVYTLKVQGRDKSNNFSGDLSYEIDYEVVTASTITHLYNYPNPFSTKTHFVFTLTGNKLPDELSIQIMTITGKVVREIFMEELGPIRIGNNKTEFFWDGRDNFGDQLANGVYLYKVNAKISGENIERRTTSADEKSFHKEFGKMYLMR